MKTKALFTTTMLVLWIMAFHSYKLSAQTYPGTPVTPIDEPVDMHVGTVTNNTGSVTTIDEAILFYNPSTSGPLITLKASLTDDDGNSFSSYKWYNMTVSSGTETENEITGETGQTLTRTQLDPGYHKFRVYGLGGESSCPSDEFEDIILFVLSPLEVKPIYNLNGNDLTYCADDIPDASDAIQFSITSLTADYSANTNGYTNPPASDFALNYQWYAVLDGDTANPISLGTNATASMTLPTSGTYTFYVEVEYEIKDKGSRDYVTYRGDINNVSNDPIEIEVTPTPGTPSITIDSVTD